MAHDVGDALAHHPGEELAQLGIDDLDGQREVGADTGRGQDVRGASQLAGQTQFAVAVDGGAHVGQGGACQGLDLGQLRLGLIGGGIDESGGELGLQGDDCQRVPQDVVHVPGHAVALLIDLQLVGALLQNAGHPPLLHDVAPEDAGAARTEQSDPGAFTCGPGGTHPGNEEECTGEDRDGADGRLPGQGEGQDNGQEDHQLQALRAHAEGGPDRCECADHDEQQTQAAGPGQPLPHPSHAERAGGVQACAGDNGADSAPHPTAGTSGQPLPDDRNHEGGPHDPPADRHNAGAASPRLVGGQGAGFHGPDGTHGLTPGRCRGPSSRRPRPGRRRARSAR